MGGKDAGCGRGRVGGVEGGLHRAVGTGARGRIGFGLCPPPPPPPLGMALPGYSAPTDYNVVNLAFWTRDGPADVALVWSDLYTYVSSDNPWNCTSTSSCQSAWKKAYNDAGTKILVSAFGATDFPTSAGADAAATCGDIASFVLDNNLDGVDLDWEDNAAMDAGTGEGDGRGL